MRIDLIYPTLPPSLDAIGQYTCRLAEALGQHGAQVRVLAGTGGSRPVGSRVEHVVAFKKGDRDSFLRLPELITMTPPDAVILQYNPFAYERLGRCTDVPRVLRDIKRRRPDVRCVLMAHECFTGSLHDIGASLTDVVRKPWLVKSVVMGAWQRPIFRAAGCAADLVAFSTEPWQARYGGWFESPTCHWAIGSAIERIPVARKEARRRLGAAEQTLVVGYFGTAHVSRMFDEVCFVIRELNGAGVPAQLLYIGPDSDAVRSRLQPGQVLTAEGPLAEAEVSQRLAAIDIYLAPFIDGASSRRTSMISGLQHSLATISTRGPSTDAKLASADGTALILVEPSGPSLRDAALLLSRNGARRAQLAQGALEYFRQAFSWDALADTVIRDVQGTTPAPGWRR